MWPDYVDFGNTGLEACYTDFEDLVWLDYILSTLVTQALRTLSC